MNTYSRLRRASIAGIGGALALISVSCGDVVRQGRGSSYVIIDTMEAASGAAPDRFGQSLASDVITFVKTQIAGAEVRVPTIFEDVGRVTMRGALKDVTPSVGLTAAPTTNNDITFTRYHVNYRRADGRATPGVDVPFAFDGGSTFTVKATGEPITVGFLLVRIQAKDEAPLKALQISNPALSISTIAEVTFYGRDQTGNEVIAAGTISVNFANWGDPQ